MGKCQNADLFVLRIRIQLLIAVGIGIGYCDERIQSPSADSKARNLGRNAVKVKEHARHYQLYDKYERHDGHGRAFLLDDARYDECHHVRAESDQEHRNV